MNFSQIKYFLLFWLFTSITQAEAQVFTRIFSGGNFEEGVSAFRMPDGSYRLLGNSASYGWGGTNIWVIALDSQAHFQWHKVVSLAGNDRVNDAVMDHKGNLHLCGTSSAQPQLTYQLMYMKIDPFGTAQQTKYYGGAAWEQGYGIAFDTDSNIVLVGETYSTPLGDAQGYILKINSSGDSLWQRSIGGNNDDVLKAVMIDTQNRIFAVGGNQNQNKKYNPWLCRFDSQGNNLWNFTLADTSNGQFNNLAFNHDHRIMAVGYQNDTTDQYSNFALTIIDTNGQLILNNQSIKHHQHSVLQSVSAVNGKMFTAGINTLYSAGQEDFYLMYTDENGYWQSSRDFGKSEEESLSSVHLDYRNGLHYLICGTTKSYNLQSSGIFFARVDSLFNWDTSSVIMIPSSTNPAQDRILRISAFPNPVHEVLHLEWNEPIGSNLTLEVYDSQGAIKMRILLPKGSKKNQLNVQQLPAGSYIIKLHSEKLLTISLNFLKI